MSTISLTPSAPVAESLFDLVEQTFSSENKGQNAAPAPVITEDAVTPAVASDRTRLIDAIERLSPRVRRDWLATFEPHALEEYLAHLAAAAKPRGRDAFWVRPSVARAISAAVAPE